MIKLILTLALLAATTSEAFAQFSCYTYRGRTVCCTTTGSFTSCN